MVRLRPAIILFGDSITQFAFGGEGGTSTKYNIGWASLLANAYQRRADVYNRGYSGYNTRHALELIPRVFGENNNNKLDVLFCTIFFGANDASLPNERQHVPLQEYGQNLSKIIQQIQQRLSSSSSSAPSLVKIIIITPPPIDEEAWKTFRATDSSDRTMEHTKTYVEEAKRIAQEHNVSVLDTFELLCKGGDGDDSFKECLCDGLHLNSKGNELIYRGLMDLIQSEFPDLAPMDNEDGNGTQGRTGIPVEEKLWREIC